MSWMLQHSRGIRPLLALCMLRWFSYRDYFFKVSPSLCLGRLPPPSLSLSPPDKTTPDRRLPAYLHDYSTSCVRVFVGLHDWFLGETFARTHQANISEDWAPKIVNKIVNKGKCHFPHEGATISKQPYATIIPQDSKIVKWSTFGNSNRRFGEMDRICA